VSKADLQKSKINLQKTTADFEAFDTQANAFIQPFYYIEFVRE